MCQTPVDKLYQEFQELIQFLDKNKQISMRSSANDNFRKVLLLATPSYFEYLMTKAVLSFVEESTSNNSLITSFIKNKAVSRQYHTWFQWDSKNANAFYGLFGEDFRDFMKEKIRDNNDLARAVEAFLELGRDRNRLVHGNYGTYSLEKTAEEIYDSYKCAMTFIELFPEVFEEYVSEHDEVAEGV